MPGTIWYWTVTLSVLAGLAGEGLYRAGISLFG